MRKAEYNYKICAGVEKSIKIKTFKLLASIPLFLIRP